MIVLPETRRNITKRDFLAEKVGKHKLINLNPQIFNYIIRIILLFPGT